MDLGVSPLANSYLEPEDLGQRGGASIRSHVYVCDECLLVQLPEAERPEAIFSDYAYFSSYSDSWLRHAEAYAEAMIERFGFGAGQPGGRDRQQRRLPAAVFEERGIPVLGIEPAANVAAGGARRRASPRVVQFFGEATARELVAEGIRADLIVGNNVLAHVPDLNDFVAGLKILLAPGGVLTHGVPPPAAADGGGPVRHHLPRALLLLLLRHGAEGLRRARAHPVRRRGAAHARRLAADLRPARRGRVEAGGRAGGGSAAPREEARRPRRGWRPTAPSASRSSESKRELLRFLIDAKEEGKSIAGYGAPAKGNTLLNYCGIRTDFLDYTVDRSPYKQGRFLPGTHIPIHAPDRIRETRPDYVLILPWNLKEEIVEQMADVRDWGGRFVVAIPEVRVLE